MPRLPRARGVSVAPSHLFRIALLAALLVLIFVFGRDCAEGVSEFVMSFDQPESPGQAAPPGPEAIDRGELRRLTDDEIREEFPSLVAPDGGGAEASGGEASGGGGTPQDAGVGARGAGAASSEAGAGPGAASSEAGAGPGAASSDAGAGGGDGVRGDDADSVEAGEGSAAPAR